MLSVSRQQNIIYESITNITDGSIRFDGGIVGPTQGDSTTLSDDDDFEATSHHTSQFNYLHTREHSNDLLIDGDSNASRSKPMTIKKYFVLLLLCAINTFGYICMPTAFVVAVSVRCRCEQGQ